MDPGPLVFDISSDEESSGHSGPTGEDFDWLVEFLKSDGKETGDDSDEVVVLSEVKPKQRSKSSKPTVRDMNDDCVILDGDPDKPAGVVDGSASGGEDDLLIVGEKGQIACRDYPHPRHHCVTFPFSTTPHEKHCDLCHCYVCDTPAPCVHWATSASSIDHCHATDKEETWRIQRRNNVPLPASNKVSDTLRPMGLAQLNPVSPLNIIELSPNSRPQSHVSRPPPIQGCSPTNFSVPTIISQGRSQPLGAGLYRNRFQPRVVSGGQPRGVNHNMRRSKGHVNSGHRFPSSPMMFKRPGSFGVSLPTNHSAYYSPNSRNHAIATQYARNTTPATALNNLNAIRWDNVNSSMHQRSSEPNLGSSVLSNPPSQASIYPSPITPSNISQNFYQYGNHFQNDSQSIYQNGNGTQNPVESNLPDGIGGARVKDTSSVDHNSSWVSNTSQSNQQPLVGHPQLQRTESLFEPSDKESSSHFNVINTNFFAEFDFDDWLLESQSAPVVSDGSVPPQSNIFSPKPAPIDAGLLLFDFKTSWNGLTRA